MTTKHRFTSQGTAWVNEPRPDRNRVRGRGARFERPQSPREKLAWCALYVAIVALAIGLSLHFASPPAIASGTEQPVSSIPTPSAFEASAAGKGSVR